MIKRAGLYNPITKSNFDALWSIIFTLNNKFCTWKNAVMYKRSHCAVLLKNTNDEQELDNILIPL